MAGYHVLCPWHFVDRHQSQVIGMAGYHVLCPWLFVPLGTIYGSQLRRAALAAQVAGQVQDNSVMHAFRYATKNDMAYRLLLICHIGGH